MKKSFLSAVLLLTSFAAQAQDPDSYMQAVLGFESGGVNIGFDYESRAVGSNAGYGGYFLFSSEKDGVSAQVMSFGAMSKIHLLDDRKFDISIAPGFGISLIELGPAEETILGPVLKFGLLYKFSEKVAFGGEMFKAYNWLSDEFGGSLDYFNLALRLKL